MSEDALKLLQILEELYGPLVRVFEGVVYFKGWRLDMDKLEAGFQRWRATQ